MNSQPQREFAGPGQESVWDYPRPPRLEATPKRIRVAFGGRLIVDSRRAFRVLETSHPPGYYVPPDDVDAAALRPAFGASFCEWKGQACYFDVVVGDALAPRAAWCYPQPTAAFAAIRDYLAFYPAVMDACYVNDEKIQPQPGGFYGGWITGDIIGPFKGGPGSSGW